MRIEGTPGLFKGSPTKDGRWDLGATDDPDRGVALGTRLAPGEVIPAHRLRDWRWSLVTGGDLTLGGRRLSVDGIVITEPHVDVPETGRSPGCSAPGALPYGGIGNTR
jgi:hypothetical protein